jgi:hypothetical protein
MPAPAPAASAMSAQAAASRIAAAAATAAQQEASKIKGGSRKTKRKASSWNKAVKRVYEEMKRKNRNATFGEAMRVASQRKKNGTL